MFKKCLSVFMALIIMFSFLTVLPLTVTAQEVDIVDGGANLDMAETGFTQRTSAPPSSSEYYYNSAYNDLPATQCTWYAWGRAYEIMGKRPNLLTTNHAKYWFGYNRDNGIYSYSTNYYEAKPGAILCCDDGGITGHVAVVEEVAADGSPAKISEGGWNGSAPYGDTVSNFSVDGYQFHYGKNYNGGFQGYIYLDGNPTPAASVNKGSEGYYTIGEKTTISVDAPNMQTAVLKIYHTPENGSTYLYWEGEIFSSQYTTSFSKKGHYSCVFIVNYGNYQTESNWVGWNIIEKPVVSIDKGQNGKYIFGEQVNFSLDVSGFDAYVLIIYRTPTNGETYEYWEGEVYGPKCTMNFYNEGYYSCCFGLWKNGYYTESEWIGWSVVEKATASVNKEPDGHYAAGEQVNFSLDVSGYDAYVLVIYRTPTNGETYEYWEGEVNGPDYTMTFYNEGYYSCCFCLWKNDCCFESGWIGWIVNNSIEPTNPSTEPSVIKLGDVDGDGEVTIIDATCIQRKLANFPTAKFVEDAADADEDGELTIIDATVIQRWLAQLPSNDNIGKPIS